MRMKDKKKQELVVRKEQLIPLQKFIYYCRDRDLKLHEDFFEAIIKEGFLLPVMTDEGEDLYSPFQIVVVARLKDNILEDGVLDYPDAHCTEGAGPDQHRVRCIRWGGNWTFVTERKFKNIIGWVKLLGDFLKLLHSLPVLGDFFTAPATENLRLKKVNNRDRFNDLQPAYRNSPGLIYDLEYLDNGAQKDFIKSRGLVEEDFVALRQEIGAFTEDFDPMGKWFYFIRRMPRWRREELRYDARIAQELYDLDDLISEMMQKLYGGETEDLHSLMKRLRPSLVGDKEEYICGTDMVSIQEAFEALKSWYDDKENKKYYTEGIEMAMTRLDTELEEFKNKFGIDWSMPTGIPYEIKQSQVPYTELPHLYKDFLERKFPEDERQGEVGNLVGFYLGDIKRNLHEGIIVARNLVEKDRDSYMPEFYRYGDPLEPNEDREECEKKMRELSDIELELTRIRCDDCRENFVKKFDKSNQSQALLCGDCIEKKKDMVLSGNDAKKQMFLNRRVGEIRCSCSNKLLYKFAGANTFISLLRGESVPAITLDYGRLTMEIACPKCGALHKRVFEYGWQK